MCVHAYVSLKCVCKSQRSVQSSFSAAFHPVVETGSPPEPGACQFTQTSGPASPREPFAPISPALGLSVCSCSWLSYIGAGVEFGSLHLYSLPRPTDHILKLDLFLDPSRCPSGIYFITDRREPVALKATRRTVVSGQCSSHAPTAHLWKNPFLKWH